MTGEFAHLPVMPQEVLACLQPVPGEDFLDGTLGGGGHARLLLEQTAPTGRLFGLDRDPAALAAAGRVLAPFGARAVLVHSDFARMAEVLAARGITAVDGILLDLGVSSPQLDEARRGFSFREDGPLDMRMDPTGAVTAAQLVNEASEEELKRIFREYGEERWAGRIVRAIAARRRTAPLKGTRELAELVRASVPGGHRPARIHPATRIFQALRIAVNGELDQLGAGLDAALRLLRPGGRLAVISFHSLEDRMVKQFFRRAASDCLCPPALPVCRCGHRAEVALLTRRGVRATEAEIAQNPRSRSAVLRAVRRLDA